MVHNIPPEIVHEHKRMLKIFDKAFIGFNAVENRYFVGVIPLHWCNSLLITKIDV